ncbi:MAG TPA: tRNA-specific 2-thiouridylase, partial [Candidatus Saccharimonadales bacterium]|nr:tRNA-specific 2-thiouridylase [Candidatus Saccharimonadales bacterium]
TYFLYRVTGKALERTLFPLGDFKKSEVRRMAKERGLITAERRDSQGICFVGQIGIKEFLSQYVETESGDIVDRSSGQMVGRHDGAIFYTLGQRHGLNVGGGLPYYVVGKDMQKNEVYVSRDLNDQAMWRQELHLDHLHWINHPPKATDKLRVRLRHRGELKTAVLDGDRLKLDEPERAVAAGQSAVIYRGDEVLGGGIVS